MQSVGKISHFSGGKKKSFGDIFQRHFMGEPFWAGGMDGPHHQP
jgi:hypothetical protein